MSSPFTAGKETIEDTRKHGRRYLLGKASTHSLLCRELYPWQISVLEGTVSVDNRRARGGMLSVVEEPSPVAVRPLRGSSTAAPPVHLSASLPTPVQRAFVPKQAAESWLHTSHAQAAEVRGKSVGAIKDLQAAAQQAQQQTVEHYNAFIQVLGSSHLLFL